MKSYGAARFYFSILEILSWIAIAVGILVLLVGIGAGSQINSFTGRGSGGMALAAAVPGLILAFLGFLSLAFAQNGRATVDAAEYAQQALKIARDQLEVSRQALKQGAALEQGYAALQAAKAELISDSVNDQAKPTATFATQPKPEPKPQPIVLSADDDELKVEGKLLTYKGQTAELVDGKWAMNGITFESPEKVVAYIDTVGRSVGPTPLPGVTS